MYFVSQSAGRKKFSLLLAVTHHLALLAKLTPGTCACPTNSAITAFRVVILPVSRYINAASLIRSPRGKMAPSEPPLGTQPPAVYPAKRCSLGLARNELALPRILVQSPGEFADTSPVILYGPLA